MKMYSATYGLRRGHFINAHCITNAAIIHLLNMSLERDYVPAVMAGEYLKDAIKLLQEMYISFPIVASHLKAIRLLAERWSVNLPEDIWKMLKSTDIPSPPSGDSNIGSPLVPETLSIPTGAMDLDEELYADGDFQFDDFIVSSDE